MKRKIFAIVLTLVLFGAMVFAVHADGNPMLWDTASLLTPSQQELLSAKLETYREAAHCDFVVITTYDTQGHEAEPFADGLYFSYDYGYGPTKDCVLLLVSIGTRDVVVVSNGSDDEAYLNNSARNHILDVIYDDLHNGDYYSAFDKFADTAAQMVISGREGHGYKEPFHLVRNFLIGLVISLLIAGGVVGKYKSELKTVRAQRAAASYVAKDSMNLTESREQFVYHQVTKTPRPKNNSTRSGGGVSHGSSSRKF